MPSGLGASGLQAGGTVAGRLPVTDRLQKFCSNNPNWGSCSPKTPTRPRTLFSSRMNVRGCDANKQWNSDGINQKKKKEEEETEKGMGEKKRQRENFGE